MKRLLGILLVVALVVPVLGAGCGSAAGDNGENTNFPPITFHLATPTPTLGPGEIQGELVELEIGSSIPLVEMVEPPERGDTVVVMLNCEARAEELIILGQYLELQGYIRDLNAQTEEMYQVLFSLWRLVKWWFPSWDVVAEQGVVVGILQVEADTVVGLPFVANIGVAQSDDPAEIFRDLLAAVAARDVDALYRTSRELARQMAGR